MKPTPEEYDLADQICRIATIYRNEDRGVTLMVAEQYPEPPASWVAAKMIAAHTAPLRERIKVLEREVETLYNIKEAHERTP